MRAVFPSLLLMFTLPACSSAVPASTTTPVTVQAQAREPSRYSSAAGDGAFLTIALRPHGLRALADAVRSAVPESFAPMIDQVVSDESFDSWLSSFTRATRHGDAPGVLSWAGLDRERPIYIRIGEGPDDLGAALGVVDDQSSSYRHVMALPTTDADALKRALVPFVAGCRNDGAWYVCETGRVDFLTHERWVFVVLRPFATDENLEAASLMGELDETEYWALHGDSPFAGLVRASPIRSAGVHQGAGMMARALTMVDPDSRNMMQASGMAEVVGAFARSSGRGREIDSWAFAVETEPLSIAVAGVLSEVGAERYRLEPGSDSVPTLSAPIVVRSSSDVAALVDATPSPLAYQEFGTNHRAARIAFRECGLACAFRGLFEPASYLSMMSEGEPLAEVMDGKVRFEVHSNLPRGTVDADAELSQLIPTFFPAGMRLAVRTRVDGGLWAGGVALTPRAAEQGLAQAQSGGASSISVASRHQGDGDLASLRCLIALGSGVAEGLHALAGSEGRDATVIERMRSQLVESAACITDPSHAAERDGYLQAFEMGAAPLAGVSL